MADAAGPPSAATPPIGRLHHVVVDCPDPLALGTFWASVLGQRVTFRSPDWVVVARSDASSGLAFQLAPDHRPPLWPDPQRPQQLHLDVMVDDLDAAEQGVLALGASRLSGDQAPSRVYADPAGHPFCLVTRPGWAPPVR